MVGVGPLRYRGTSLCWGRSVTFNLHRSVEITQVRWVHLARQYIALPRPQLPLRMESSVSRDLCSHVPQSWGSSGSSSLVYVSRRLVVRCVTGGGGVGWGGWSSLSRVGSGDGVFFGGRGRADSRWCVLAGASVSIGWWGLPRVASVAWSRGGGAGGGGVGVALLVVGGAGVGVALAGGPGFPVRRVGVACARCAVLAVPGWLRCRGQGGRRPHGRPGGATVPR